MGDILIVDGNPQSAMQLAQLLEELGANARIAGTFYHSLKRMEEKTPDLALVAEILPDGRGLKLLPVFEGLCPVVIVGEYMASDRILEALSLGARDFLDEIGEASPAFQAKLLRVLDRGEFVRVGGQSLIQTQVRVIAATNRDLDAMIEQGEFRLDLFYRLSAVTLSLPPLRERSEDIPHIVQAMLTRLKADTGLEVQGVSAAAVAYLARCEWPGNLRELQHAIYRAALACQKGIIRPEHLDVLRPTQSSTSDKIETLYETEQAHIERVMLATGGNQGRACELLGISRPTLRRKIRRYAVERMKNGQIC